MKADWKRCLLDFGKTDEPDFREGIWAAVRGLNKAAGWVCLVNVLSLIFFFFISCHMRRQREEEEVRRISKI